MSLFELTITKITINLIIEDWNGLKPSKAYISALFVLLKIEYFLECSLDVQMHTFKKINILNIW